MDVWPGYSGEHASSVEKSKGKGKGKAKAGRAEGPWRYPVVEHGTLGAATLKKEGRRFEWTFASEGSSDHKLVASDGPLEVFPPTRPKPWRGPQASELQRAEQGAHFLRTFYPEIDIQAELIREEIAEDGRAARALQREDPYAGNAIDVSSFQVSHKSMAYVAFPMGLTNCQLNMSPLVIRQKTEVELKPVAAPVYTFDTPIRQITASPHDEDFGKSKPGPVLGVRTVGSTSFLQIRLAVNKTPFTVEPAPLLTVQRSELSDRHAVDLTISSINTSVGYVVTDAGAIFRCSTPEGRRNMQQISACDASERSLYRIAAASCVREALLSVSERSASFLDLRAGKRPQQLYSVGRPKVVLTSVESLSDDRIIRLVSSEEIIWLDERNTRRALLAVKHGRELDTTLRSFTRVVMSSPLTFLTSQRNSLVTVYDVSRGNGNLVYLHEPPYALPPVLQPDGPHSGYAFFQQPTLVGSKHVSMLQLSDRGGVSLLNLQRVPNDAIQDAPNPGRRRADWPDDVKKLGSYADAAHRDLGPLAGRGHDVVDLQPAYEKLFMERDEPHLAAQSEAVFDTLERMPSFWQDTDIPVEHCLTTFDIAMRSGREPVNASRNDWFTGSALNSAAGYRALVQGQLPHTQLVRNTPWHLDISSFIRRTVPELKEDAQQTMESLSRYDLADGPDRTAPSFRQENEARSQVALDLSLASDIFAQKRPGRDIISSFDEDLLNISRSTEAMSLGDRIPPPVQFSFLRPIQKDDTGPESALPEVAEDASKSNTQLGVRLLLQEWEVAADPYHYVYRDPYDEPDEASAWIQYPTKSSVQKDAHTTKEARPPAQVRSQRPPVIALSIPKGPPPIPASQLTVPRKPLTLSRSHDTLSATPKLILPSASQPSDTPVAPPSSQEFMASTQVLPGPHGGRPPPAKKKPVKKRLGGF
ncbi:hypothetical protein BD414DRAFT_414849 [Trametes punicea]|nr:hypothetical protein BD414DRAFT_414849 [Trametes punicea]